MSGIGVLSDPTNPKGQDTHLTEANLHLNTDSCQLLIRELVMLLKYFAPSNINPLLLIETLVDLLETTAPNPDSISAEAETWVLLFHLIILLLLLHLKRKG